MPEYLEFAKIQKCIHAQTCSGCFYFQDNLQLALQNQETQKRSEFFHKMAALDWNEKNVEFQYLNPYPLFYRNHLDFTLDHGKLGLYEKRLSEQEYSQIIDLQECLVLNQQLLFFLKKIKPFFPHNKRGSVRVRYFDSNRFGVWLDFANLDIKEFLEEKDFLLHLLEHAYLEIGQRGKKLVQENDKLKLRDPEYHPWFATKMHDQTIPLYSLVKSFTQSGLGNNFRLIQEIQNEYRQKLGSYQRKQALEMGSGIGNLTFPFLEFFEHLTCFEWDRTSLQGLQMTLDAQELQGVVNAKRVRLLPGDFHQQNSVVKIDLNEFDGLILNPARSGVGSFLKQLMTNTSIQHIFLMSCYLDSFAKDAEMIQQAGFKCDKIKMIDQFSFSSHFEILSFWSR